MVPKSCSRIKKKGGTCIMKKILNRMAKIGLEIVMYLFEHIFLVIGIAILIILLIAKM